MTKLAPKFNATYRANRVSLDFPENYRRYCELNFKEGDRLVVTAKKMRRIRSTGAPGEKGNQNGWLHGVIIPMAAEDRGYDPEELKEEYIAAFAPKKKVRDLKTGNLKWRPKRTSEMDTLEFAEFCQRIIQEEAERGLVIPDPEKVDVE